MNTVSRPEGLERLKKWQQAERTLFFPVEPFPAREPLRDVRVRIEFVDECGMLLAMLEDPFQSESKPLAGAVFSAAGSADLRINFPDGREWYLREAE